MAIPYRRVAPLPPKVEAMFVLGKIKKVRHIERKRNIPPKKYVVYTLHFSRGILHYVQNDVFFYPSREIAAVATLLRKDK